MQTVSSQGTMELCETSDYYPVTRALLPVLKQWRIAGTPRNAARTAERRSGERASRPRIYLAPRRRRRRRRIDHLIECRRLDSSPTKTKTADQKKTFDASFIGETTFHMIPTDWVQLGETDRRPPGDRLQSKSTSNLRRNCGLQATSHSRCVLF